MFKTIYNYSNNYNQIIKVEFKINKELYSQRFGNGIYSNLRKIQDEFYLIIITFVSGEIQEKKYDDYGKGYSEFLDWEKKLKK